MSSFATSSEHLKMALDLPNGARFYRCALQINPFDYLIRHQKTTPFENEADYNIAIIAACQQQGVEVIGVTDHYRVKNSVALVQAARNAGIFAFGGFEAVTKDGVHFLCLFDPCKDSALEGYIGDCGIHDESVPSPTGNKDCHELLEATRQWESICIAAHVAADQGGLLKKLTGQTCMKVWQSPALLACAMSGRVDDETLNTNLQRILQNKDPHYRRDRPLAIINAQDVTSPEDLLKPGSSCLIKMSTISVEALRQAFLDPISRVRLNSDTPAEPHTEFVALTWEGGFLRDSRVHFNENLNVLVGGRGTGKSTLIESLRYVLNLDPLGEDAKKAHQGVLREVLKNGTKISLLVRSHSPSLRHYTIERTLPNPPVVKDENGIVLTLTPREVLPGVEIFGQHEISELTKSREKLTLLLERFVKHDPSDLGRKTKLKTELERSRRRMGELKHEILTIEERLETSPHLEETLKRYQEAGLETKLKEKSLLVSEERLLGIMIERLTPFKDLWQELTSSVPIDAAFLAPKALEGLPNADVLGGAEAIFGQLSVQLKAVVEHFAAALKVADDELSVVRRSWDERHHAAEANYETLLRELQRSKIDGEEFIRLRRQIEELRPLRERREHLVRELAMQESHRQQLLDDWNTVKSTEFRNIERAAKKVNKKLGDRINVEVTMAGNREPFEKLLREEIGGNLSSVLDRLRERDDLSLADFALRCREGKDALMNHYQLPSGGADRISQAAPTFFMLIEELELSATTKIALNTAAAGEPPSWQLLEHLSTGQKATAVLLLLLLESEAPLVVDQPEDDLDNRFITEGVVPIMRKEKLRRQFVFSTHNANIPVLGDAELILGLQAAGEGQARIDPHYMGSIDEQPVRELIEEILEGGKAAFEMRRAKYGF